MSAAQQVCVGGILVTEEVVVPPLQLIRDVEESVQSSCLVGALLLLHSSMGSLLALLPLFLSAGAPASISLSASLSDSHMHTSSPLCEDGR